MLLKYHLEASLILGTGKPINGLLPRGAKEGPCSLQDLQDEVDQSGNPQVAKCLGT